MFPSATMQVRICCWHRDQSLKGATKFAARRFSTARNRSKASAALPSDNEAWASRSIASVSCKQNTTHLSTGKLCIFQHICFTVAAKPGGPHKHGVTTHDVRCTRGFDIRLKSGSYSWYPAVGYGRNMTVFSKFFHFFFWQLFTEVYSADISLYSAEICQKYLIEIWSIFSWYPFIITLTSNWYPVDRFPGSCYPLGTSLLTHNSLKYLKWKA